MGQENNIGHLCLCWAQWLPAQPTEPDPCKYFYNVDLHQGRKDGFIAGKTGCYLPKCCLEFSMTLCVTRSHNTFLPLLFFNLALGYTFLKLCAGYTVMNRRAVCYYFQFIDKQTKAGSGKLVSVRAKI